MWKYPKNYEKSGQQFEKEKKRSALRKCCASTSYTASNYGEMFNFNFFPGTEFSKKNFTRGDVK